METHDPRILRAIAHPVRARVLAELGASGSLRAADIARELDIPANQASFHLRQLAKYGLVMEDPAAARDKRDRVWRLADDSGWRVDLEEMEKEPGGRAATGVFRRNFGDWCRHMVDRALTATEDDDELRHLNNSSIRLSKEEAEEFIEELGELFRTWRDKTRGAGDDRRTYSYLMIMQPFPGLGADDADTADTADTADSADTADNGDED